MVFEKQRMVRKDFDKKVNTIVKELDYNYLVKADYQIYKCKER